MDNHDFRDKYSHLDEAMVFPLCLPHFARWRTPKKVYLECHMLNSSDNVCIHTVMHAR